MTMSLILLVGISRGTRTNSIAMKKYKFTYLNRHTDALHKEIYFNELGHFVGTGICKIYEANSSY